MQGTSVTNGQIAAMSAIVATLLLPTVALLAAVGAVAFDVSPHAIATFGDTFNEPVGLLVWWAAALVPGYAYAMVFSPG